MLTRVARIGFIEGVVVTHETEDLFPGPLVVQCIALNILQEFTNENNEDTVENRIFAVSSPSNTRQNRFMLL